ncbi:hypothetical protein [Thiohalomonas denitrificans]|uniref:hypothetical protein n=1 Tax=Thiohalomonas denitrificans TaxID=415747 RepID=UPI0026E9D64B|nr:hypothetical protein [Thiohalomonas denitrificans]
MFLYLDDQQEGSPWSLSAEMRFGPGSFTDPGNNSTGDTFGLHKAWVGYSISDTRDLKLGKSQVPFGWKTVNFWPGDLLLGGYGDQMDVGVKYSETGKNTRYQLAYYHADDWGETSTDTMDDNGHWGSSESYRKVHTVVGNIDYRVAADQWMGVSLQAGELQDLRFIDTVPAEAEISGDHSAWNLHYEGRFDEFLLKAQWLDIRRDIPGETSEIKNQRAAIELGFDATERWFTYLDASWADTDTAGNDSDAVTAFAPGARYHYGPGWIYLEYLTSNGDIGPDGDIYEADFSAIYASIDYYF